MDDFKKALSELHVRIADHLQDIERVFEMDAERGQHCLVYFNKSIDKWFEAFEYVKKHAEKNRDQKQNQ